MARWAECAGPQTGTRLMGSPQARFLPPLILVISNQKEGKHVDMSVSRTTHKSQLYVVRAYPAVSSLIQASRSPQSGRTRTETAEECQGSKIMDDIGYL